MNANFTHPSLVKLSFFLHQDNRNQEEEEQAVAKFIKLLFARKLCNEDILLFCRLLDKYPLICEVIGKQENLSEQLPAVGEWIAVVSTNQLEKTVLYSYLIRYCIYDALETMFLAQVVPEYVSEQVIFNLLQGVTVSRLDKIINLLQTAEAKDAERIKDYIRGNTDELVYLTGAKFKRRIAKINELL